MIHDLEKWREILSQILLTIMLLCTNYFNKDEIQGSVFLLESQRQSVYVLLKPPHL